MSEIEKHPAAPRASNVDPIRQPLAAALSAVMIAANLLDALLATERDAIENDDQRTQTLRSADLETARARIKVPVGSGPLALIERAEAEHQQDLAGRAIRSFFAKRPQHPRLPVGAVAARQALRNFVGELGEHELVLDTELSEFAAEKAAFAAELLAWESVREANILELEKQQLIAALCEQKHREQLVARAKELGLSLGIKGAK